MDRQLAQLISDYQSAVGAAVLQMSQSGIETPTTISDWRALRIPARGQLRSGAAYYKHGYGCTVDLPTGEVDFDFGQVGEIDGFDEWRLWRFCQSRTQTYTFDSLEEIIAQVRHALNKRWLISSNDLYFVPDSVEALDAEATQILAAGCPLPHVSRDSVRTLSAQCFESASLMLDHYEALNRRLSRGQKLGRGDRVKFRVYLMSWLGYLRATVEGFMKSRVRLLLQKKRPAEFLELLPICNEIGALEKRYADDLRVLRNDTFHLRTDNDAISKFFSDDGARMDWTKELHEALGAFFSNYRVLSEVHLVRHGRLGESEIRNEGRTRRGRKPVVARRAAAVA